MTEKLKRYYNHVSGKNALVFFVIFLLFTALVLPAIASLTTRVIGVAESPDTGFMFDVEVLYQLLDSYGASGRRFYITMRWTFDVVWPIVYTLFLLSSIGYLSKQTACKFQYKLLYLPLFSILFDLLENTFITILMVLYPSTVDFIGYLFILASLIKWIFISISFLVLFLLVIRLVYRKIKN